MKSSEGNSIRLTNFRLIRTVHCHDITHPPTEHRGNDINLILTGSDSTVQLNRVLQSQQEKSFVTQYSMVISDPQSVGFTSDDRNTVDREFRNLLLAFNLLLCRVCILAKDTSFSHLVIEPDIPESQSHVRKVGNRFEVHLSDTVVVTDNHFAEIGFEEKVDDKDVVNMFNKLQRFKRFELNPNSARQDINLGLSLSDYEEAMSTFETLYKFKHLFNSLEHSTDIDGKKLEGPDFDRFYNSLSLTPNTNVTDWRKLYNRIKHSARNSNDIKNYFNGIQNLREYIMGLRKSCRDLLLLRLL